MHPPPLEPVPGDQVTPDSADRRSSSWDLRHAPRNYIWLVLYQALGSAAGFAAVYLIIRYIGTDGYGGVVALIAASQIVQIFLNWTTVAVIRYGVDELVETGAIARAFWCRSVIFAINLVLVVALAWQWFPLVESAWKLTPDLFWLLLVHLSVTALWVHVQMGMQAAKLLREQGMLLMTERVLVLTSVLAVLALHLLDIRSAVLCYIAAPALMILAGIFQLRRVIFVRFALGWDLFRKILVYSLPLLPYWLVGFLSGGYIDAAFIRQYLSQADLGVYNVAVQINGIVMQLPTLANTILLPLLLTQEAEAAGERSFFYFRKVLPWLVLGCGLCCAILAFAGYVMIPLVFSQKPEMSAVAIPLWVLLASSVFWVPVAVGYAAYANAISATYMSLVSSCFAATVNIVGDWYLIPRYGMVGCAWATVGAYAVTVVVFVVLLGRFAKMPSSWILLAFVPTIAGSVAITWLGHPLWALAVCASLTLVIALFERATIGDLRNFVNGLLKTANAPS